MHNRIGHRYVTRAIDRGVAAEKRRVFAKRGTQIQVIGATEKAALAARVKALLVAVLAVMIVIVATWRAIIAALRAIIRQMNLSAGSDRLGATER